jgi:hypothetical protein
MEYYSVIKQNEILSFTGKWTELEIIIVSEISQVQKDKGCMLSLICESEIQVLLCIFAEHVFKGGIVGD